MIPLPPKKLISLAICCWSVAWTAFAEKPLKPMTAVGFLDLPELSMPHLSPDGARLAFVRTDTDWAEDRLSTSLWCCDADDHAKTKRLAAKLSDISSPQWSPDGKRLAFLADPPGSRRSEVFLVDPAVGEPRRLTSHPTTVLNLQWSADGSHIYYEARDKRVKPEEGGNRFRIRPFDRPQKASLWSVDVASGDHRKVFSGDFHVRSFHASAASDRVVVQCSGGTLIDDRHTSSSLWLIDSNGARKISKRRHEQLHPRLSPDGKSVLYLADYNFDGDLYYQKNLFVLSVEDQQLTELLSEDFPYEVDYAEWGPDSRTIYVTANQGVRSGVYAVDAETGEYRVVDEGDHDVRAMAVASCNPSIVLQKRDVASPGEFWRVDPAGDKAAKRITTIYADLERETLLPTQEIVRWRAKDGVWIEGLLTKPVKNHGRIPAPLIVQCHGGPRKSDKFGFWRWRNYQPVLAAEGYATFNVNYRGSTGYGEAFHRDMVGDYFRHSAQDVLDGVDFLVREGLADPEQLAIMGWSAGGHMTNKLITITDRFKAASSGAGAVEWISMYGESDSRFFRTPWFGGAPWSKKAPLQSYLAQSPLKDMWRAKTPTVIFVGAEDARVPATQSILLSRALTANNVSNCLYIAPNQEHDWVRPSFRLFKVNAEFEWFERHVRNREHTWWEPPGNGELKRELKQLSTAPAIADKN